MPAMFSRFLQRSSRPKTTNPVLEFCRNSHSDSIKGLSSINPKPISRVAVFWDLDNKPPASFPPYEAAIKLRATAASFGFVKQMVAYANHHAFKYVPVAVREQRKERKVLNQMENKGLIQPPEPYFCGVCGRRFYSNDKLVNHFRQIHETENQKRLRQIESAKGNRRVRLVGKYTMKMDKYKRAARKVLTPKEGYGLAEELKRGGFRVKEVSDNPEAADKALKEHMIYVMDKREVECVVLVSDDSGFAGILREAKERCVRTVVVGDLNDGALKRVADVGFSWKEVVIGKAKKQVDKVVGKWKDRDVLKKLEWTYDPVMEKEKMKERGFSHVWDCEFNDDGEEIETGAGLDSWEMTGAGAWWEMDDEDNDGSSIPCEEKYEDCGEDG
ncbi:PREDICTED: uncharacterized protein LOC104806346 [Tarenaya hassleriana]|uniref:uncharacterized protein LOC104806346 n=1 Tax=Tarenaya hassleriana TaxID=28532 RepID=UPI00053C7D91|nr:PREDICTED: uncharacterized protein LOC104806346 [Tarenaya hassleriana]XP_010529499.1 PREDICTED: uncharacterized protein LOC104806346 [Tarenaya hassleriana]XP_010529500.1 PREDICTED: uncharacterized protein LOC104806346 [Tarenaya hassleriana]XP_010529501.1 PREDICTED: uncharacterized protein LOC104806346 [Tarenaya hassleriana]XP_010529502.1 PREDICTED: uncharacterized protein LOC104806346 [Tarenaya hassleriana]XP_010529503.1 PREDICTED: uncharacterized protein LOC104806346 [Tarenaya hassleriana]